MTMALTIWQPWCSLIVFGAKPYEFRKWDFSRPFPDIVGQRIVLHAGSRPVKVEDLDDILTRIADGVSQLDAAIATPVLSRLRHALVLEAEAKPEYRRRLREYQAAVRRMEARPRFRGDAPPPPAGEPPEPPPSGQLLMLGAGIGTAIVGKPVRAAELFDRPTNDSYRVDHAIWAWPLTEIEPWPEPIPASGAQGFWEWRA